MGQVAVDHKLTSLHVKSYLQRYRRELTSCKFIGSVMQRRGMMKTPPGSDALPHHQGGAAPTATSTVAQGTVPLPTMTVGRTVSTVRPPPSSSSVQPSWVESDTPPTAYGYGYGYGYGQQERAS